MGFFRSTVAGLMLCLVSCSSLPTINSGVVQPRGGSVRLAGENGALSVEQSKAIFKSSKQYAPVSPENQITCKEFLMQPNLMVSLSLRVQLLNHCKLVPITVRLLQLYLPELLQQVFTSM